VTGVNGPLGQFGEGVRPALARRGLLEPQLVAV
jgi:hypothetical protein